VATWLARGVAATVVLLLSGAAAAAQPAAERLLVVPFENAGSEAHYQWLSEASAVLLTDGLRARDRDAITRLERVNAFRQLDLPVAGSLTRATVIKVGHLLGARDLIVGSFGVAGDELTVSAQVIRVDVGRVEPPTTERGPLTDLFAVYDRLARRLAHDARVTEGTGPNPPLDAFESFIKGLLAENPATRNAFLEAAIREHPDFDRARLALWEVRTDQGDHDSALATVRTVRSGSPFARRAQFAAAVSLLELKRHNEAFEAFTALLDATPDDSVSAAAILNNLGVVQIRRGAAPPGGSAPYYLTKAADADRDPDYLFNLGYAYVLDRQFQGAIYWLREAVRRDPTDADAHFVLAAALQGSGSAVEGARERDLAKRLSARYEELDGEAAAAPPPVPVGLERVALEPEVWRALRADHAIVTSTQREHTELAAFHLDRGRRLFDKEQDREAMAELRRAVYLSPYDADAHLLIGRIHLRGGRFGDAVDALKISLWSEETVAGRIALAEAFLKAGNSAQARSEAERALALDPDSADAKRLLAIIK